VTDSILDKALGLLGREKGESTFVYSDIVHTNDIESIVEGVEEAPSTAPNTSEKNQVQLTKENELNPLLGADLELEAAFPNLIFRNADVGRVLRWLGTVEGVALDVETHGTARKKEDHKKEALAFIRGQIRLVQLAGGGEDFILDAALLSKDAVSRVLGQLHGRPLYLHNAIFDLPRLLRAFGVDLLEEDVRDTLILSRLLRAGQWEEQPTKDGGVMDATKKHNIADALFRELGVEIPKETDHRWGEPLTEGRLRYASDDVLYLEDLYQNLLSKVEKVGLLDAYRLIRKVRPVYLRQQARGVPFDAELYKEMRTRLQEKIVVLQDQLAEHAPEHPEAEEGGAWVWRNFNKPEKSAGRNGVLKALALAGTPLTNVRKHTRLAYLRKDKEASLLRALDQYLRHDGLMGDTKNWLEHHYEDGRLYPNVQFFSQVTGRSAYSEAALQNMMKEIDLPGMEKTSFRDCIRVPEGSAIVKADYSAQELRILAHATGDRNLIKAFLEQARGGKDPHLVVGEQIAGKELDKETPKGKAYRKSGKRANYGFSYGAGWPRYQRSIYEDTADFISDEQAKKEKRAFEEAWPQVKVWQQTFGDRAGHEPGAWYTTSFTGRRRYVGRNKEGRPNYCDRLNGPIQQGGADQLYLALGRMVDDPLPGVHVIITTHDEVVLECSDETAEKAKEWLKGHMIAAVRETIGEELATPDCVEVEDGQSWGA
jgi:DNA polymerase I-like protein with 3'-5' exonuclease and polymerase domains